MSSALSQVHRALDRALGAAKLVSGTDLTVAMTEVTFAIAELPEASLAAPDLDRLKERLVLLKSLCSLLKNTSYSCLERAAVIEGAGYRYNHAPRCSAQALVRRYG